MHSARQCLCSSSAAGRHGHIDGGERRGILCRTRHKTPKSRIRILSFQKPFIQFRRLLPGAASGEWNRGCASCALYLKRLRMIPARARLPPEQKTGYKATGKVAQGQQLPSSGGRRVSSVFHAPADADLISRRRVTRGSTPPAGLYSRSAVHFGCGHAASAISFITGILSIIRSPSASCAFAR